MKQQEVLKRLIDLNIKWNDIIAWTHNICKQHLHRVVSGKVNLSEELSNEIDIRNHTKIIESPSHKVTIIIERK